MAARLRDSHGFQAIGADHRLSDLFSSRVHARAAEWTDHGDVGDSLLDQRGRTRGGGSRGAVGDVLAAPGVPGTLTILPQCGHCPPLPRIVRPEP